MQGNYGSRFLNQWKTGQKHPDGDDIGVRNAMAVWAKKLGGFSEIPDAIKAVLDNLPPEPPSLPEFVRLCRSAAAQPKSSAPRLAHRMTPEEKARADRATEAAMKALNRDRRDHKAWAKSLQRRHESGEVLTVTQIESYREALRITEEPAANDAEALAA